jgi:hypothetical protein
LARRTRSNSIFSTNFYLGVDRDVLAVGANPLDHYHDAGWKEGRDPSANFDTGLYLKNNPDVAAAISRTTRMCARAG